MDWGAIVIAVISAVGLDRVIIYLDQRESRRRQASAEAVKTEAEARSIFADADSKTLDKAYKLIEYLDKSVVALNDRVDRQDQAIGRLRTALQAYAERVAYLMGGIATLMRQITESNQAPCWKPDEWQPPNQEGQ